MDSFFTAENMTFLLAVIAALFTAFNYLKNPQVKSDKTEALLAQQIKLKDESVDRRFEGIQKSIEDLLLQQNNHVHSLDVKVNLLGNHVVDLDKQIVRLTTIIEERLSKKDLPLIQ